MLADDGKSQDSTESAAKGQWAHLSAPHLEFSVEMFEKATQAARL